MSKYFVDTNLFLRFLTNDIPKQARILERLLERGANDEISLISNSMVIAEIVWTLQSFYKFSKAKIDEVVSPIVASRSIEFSERDVLLQALEDFHTLNIDFIDAYIAGWMKENGITEIFTMNAKDFKRIQGVHIAHFLRDV